jgi:Cd2+/Zn2+-exporting ATPase
MVTEKFILENLCCADCGTKIEERVSKLPEVESCRLDFINKTLSVTTSQGREIEHNISRIVKSIEPDVKVKPMSQPQTAFSQALPISLYLAGIGVLVLLSVYVFRLSGQTRTVFFLAAYALCSWKVQYNAIVKAFSGRLLDEHFLMSIASFGALYLGEYPEAVAVMVLYEIGQFFENKAVNKSRNAIKSMLNLKPEFVHRLVNDKSGDVLIAEIAVNEHIAVLPGERIPLDGTVLQGQSSLDTSALTGEAMPVTVEEGSQVLSGTMNLSGRLVLKVTSKDADSTVTRILKLVEDATQRKSTTERFITRFARKYTPAVVLTAIFIALVMPALNHGSFNTWLERSLIFLIISCPCALIISIPLTNYAAIGAAARKGILLKGSNFLDALARAQTFVYDKTGTLTTGNLAVLDIAPVEGVSEDKLIQAALSCEENSNHPLAQAIRNKFKHSYQTRPSLMHHEFHGKGIRAQMTDTTYYAGSRVFLQEQGVLNLPAEPVETCIYIAEQEQCLGFITFRDEIKAEFPEVIRLLKKAGIRKHIMLTGDHAIQAQKVATDLKLDKVYGRLLPGEKLDELEKIINNAKSPVAFIGDGLNDAPVLSRAEIGIAMGAIGNQASIEAADVVLMQDEPKQLLAAVLMARKTKAILWQNILLALGIKAAVMVLGTLGMATLWEAVIADVGVTLLAVMNAMRILRT